MRGKWPDGFICCRGEKEEKVGVRWGRKVGIKVEEGSGEASGGGRRKEKD